ncbi:MAG TPA: single-stranded DNA-binding protein [Bacillota bacterium]|nr:single-stranded DNA-binding protein [Bacillota bacterium]
MINKVVLVGRLTRDPELKSTQSGISVTTFTLAVERNFTNQQGEREADFIPIVTWRGLADTCAKYLAKGRLTAVSGRMQVRNYETQEGQRRYITEVVADEVQFLEWAQPDSNSGYERSNQADQPNQAPAKGPQNTGFQPIDDDDDELPF